MGEINMSMIISFVTMVITFILGELAKKCEYLEKNQIPIQNMLIGILSGIIAYATGLTNNLISSIVICFISAFGAGGIYDFSQTKGISKGDDENEH